MEVVECAEKFTVGLRSHKKITAFNIFSNLNHNGIVFSDCSGIDKHPGQYWLAKELKEEMKEDIIIQHK